MDWLASGEQLHAPEPARYEIASAQTFYLALAQRIHGAFWTLDGKLVRNAAPKGYEVRWLGDSA